MGKKQTSFRNTSTDDAIIQIVAAAGGEVSRRMIVRKMGHRAELSAALNRLARRGAIELFQVTVGAHTLHKVRLIGDTAVQKGAGFVRVGGRK